MLYQFTNALSWVKVSFLEEEASAALYHKAFRGAIVAS